MTSCSSRSWDIFCTVIDNFGDIGVAWRLARQLSSEHGIAVRLWVDDLSSFARIWPAVDATQAQQYCEGIGIRHWSADIAVPELGEVVIEAFACTLPDSIVTAMAAMEAAPRWINLEYLSAETWTESCHGLPSPQGDGLQKYFFFPGFTEKVGGLLREQSLFVQRDTVQASVANRQQALRALGIEWSGLGRVFSLFAYELPQLGAWLEALNEADEPILLLVPEGRVLGDVHAWLAQQADKNGGALQVKAIPFLLQTDYDRLLWACDFNAVRGEDSFVRAQWAAKPMVWHIYPQDDDAHLEKLDAFLAHYVANYPAEQAGAVSDFWRAWNTGQNVKAAWQQWMRCGGLDAKQPAMWSDQLAKRPDLAAGLVSFCRN